jgi:alkaline phosphatase D
MMLNRRALLKGVLATPVVLLGTRMAPSRAAPSWSADYGVASGDPRPDNVVLWTRVPESAQPLNGEAIAVQYQVALADTFTPGSLAAAGEVVTDATSDYTVKVLVAGLTPATHYYYRFTTPSSYQSVIGETRTAPALDAQPDTISFAFVSCQSYPDGFYTVLARLAQADVDFCVHLGDNIYARGAPIVIDDPVRQDPIGEAMTLTDYRQKYQLYLSDPHLREVRRRFPWVVVWDDHELFDNYAGSVVAQQDPQRQRDAYTAFLEYMPVQPVTPLSPSGTPDVRLYRQLSFGDLLDVWVLDERQYRDGIVCERDFFITGCPELDDPERTMLGAAQKSWLKTTLMASQTRWKCLLNPVMMMRLALATVNSPGLEELPRRLLQMPALSEDGFYVSLDAWDGYPAERAELLQFIADQQIRNVVVCTGDLHNCVAGLLRPDFTAPETPPVAVEVVGGSVSSINVADALGRNPTPLARRIIPQINPHIQFLDLNYHVYTKVTVTAEHMDVRYIAVQTIREPTSAAFVLQHFRIRDGEARLRRL